MALFNNDVIYKASMMVQWVALPPHSPRTATLTWINQL